MSKPKMSLIQAIGKINTFHFAILMVVILGLSHTQFVAPVHAATKIAVIVNKSAITSLDISRRRALLRLQRTKGNHAKIAKEQLVNEALQQQELTRTRLLPDEGEVNAAFARFAAGNKLSSSQLSKILGQSGVGSKHFKNFIRIQIGWPRLVSARYGGSAGGLSKQELATKMLELGENKPTTTEYILQQVIFVVPKSKRSNSRISVRKREANKFRAKYQSCDTTKKLAKGLLDVSVKNLGRFMQQQLPPEWSKQIQAATLTKPTTIRVTDKGVEFVAICKSRKISDDAAAEIVFRAEASGQALDSGNSKKYLEDLRKRAVISYK